KRADHRVSAPGLLCHIHSGCQDAGLAGVRPVRDIRFSRQRTYDGDENPDRRSRGPKMVKLRSTAMIAGALCVAGAALAADGANDVGFPIFGITTNTGWVLDRAIGPDDLIPLK